MPALTNLDHDLLAQLAAQPGLRVPESLHPDMARLHKLVGYGWVTTTCYRQGGTIYRLTRAGRATIEAGPGG